MHRTKGQIEAEFSEAIIKFEKEYMGRGLLNSRTFIVSDMILVRLKGVLTQAEQQLVSTGEETKGQDFIKQVRIALLEKGSPLLETVVESITGCKVKSLHTDISTRP